MGNERRRPIRCRGPLGIRTRITAVALAAVVVPLVVAIAATGVVLHQALTGSLADRTAGRAREVADVLASGGIARVQAEQPLLADNGRVVQVLDPAGAVVYSSAPAGTDGVALTSADPGDGEMTVSGISAWPSWRDPPPPILAATGVSYGLQRYTVVVAASQENQDEAVRLAARGMLGGLPLLLAGAGLMTWLALGRVLRSVNQIRQTAEDIGGTAGDARIAVPAPEDELAWLARTLNTMLDRLQAGRDAQRRFVANASHELRSPLTSMRTVIQLGVADPDAADWRELLPILDDESARLQRLVEDLLTLSKAEETGGIPLRITDVDVDDIVAAQARRLEAIGGVAVRRHIVPSRVRGDTSALTRAIRNLVDNAARAATSTVALSVQPGAEQVAVTVDDDGPGVPQGDRDRVFDRFVRLDDERERTVGGSGLGLAIVAGVVRSHRGTVAVTDSPLGGARFVVTLPTSQTADDAPASATASYPLDAAGSHDDRPIRPSD